MLTTSYFIYQLVFLFLFLKLLELLLETKANGCVRDIKHKTPLHLAADRGTARQVRVLTQAAPSCVWMRDDQRRTPLHYAVISMKRYFIEAFYFQSGFRLTTMIKRNKCNNNTSLP